MAVSVVAFTARWGTSLDQEAHGLGGMSVPVYKMLLVIRIGAGQQTLARKLNYALAKVICFYSCKLQSDYFRQWNLFDVLIRH